MSDPITPNFGFTLPTVGGDADTWGGLNNGNWSSVDSILGNVTSIIEIAGTELIGLSGSVTGVSSSLAGVSTSQAGVSTSLVSTAASLSGISASLSSTNSTAAGVSSSLAGVSTSLGGVSSSVAGLSTSTAGVSSSLTGVSSSLAGVSTSLGSAASGTNANSLGFLGAPGNPQSGAYTLLPTDAGKTVYSTNTGAQTVTVATNATEAIAVDSVILIVNDGTGVITISPASGVTLILAGPGTTGSRSLAVKGMATLIQVATNRWYVTGPGLT